MLLHVYQECHDHACWCLLSVDSQLCVVMTKLSVLEANTMGKLEQDVVSIHFRFQLALINAKTLWIYGNNSNF